MAYCPDCTSYLVECTPEAEDISKPCKYYQSRICICSVCGTPYNIELGCFRCENGHMGAET